LKLSPFLKIGEIKKVFQIVENVPLLLRDNFNIIVKTGVRINLQLCRKIEGIPSGLVLSLRLEIKLRIFSSVRRWNLYLKCNLN